MRMRLARQSEISSNSRVFPSRSNSDRRALSRVKSSSRCAGSRTRLWIQVTATSRQPLRAMPTALAPSAPLVEPGRVSAAVSRAEFAASVLR